MGLYNRFCKRFFAAVIIRLTAQSDSREPVDSGLKAFQTIIDFPTNFQTFEIFHGRNRKS